MSVPEADAERTDSQNFSRKAVYFGLLFEGALIVLAWLLGWFFSLPLFAAVTFDFSSIGSGVAAALPMLAGFALVIWLPMPAFKRLLRIFDELGRPFFASYTVIDLALLSLAAGVGEELLFRGVVQPVLGGWAGPWVGLIAASVLFGALHALTPTYAALATLAGLYLGGIWLLTDNLLVVIIAHGLYDFIALVYLLRYRTLPVGLEIG